MSSLNRPRLLSSACAVPTAPAKRTTSVMTLLVGKQLRLMANPLHVEGKNGLVLLAACERQRVNAGSQRRKRIVGQFDPVRQVGREKHQGLLRGVAVGNHGSDADRAELDRLAILGPDQRGI